MSHRAHPAEGDKADAILFDYCEDCELKAKDLGVNLDPDRWSTMWRRMLVSEMPNWRKDYPRELPGYRSLREKDLGQDLYKLYLLLERRNLYALIHEFVKG